MEKTTQKSDFKKVTIIGVGQFWIPFISESIP